MYRNKRCDKNPEQDNSSESRHYKLHFDKYHSKCKDLNHRMMNLQTLQDCYIVQCSHRMSQYYDIDLMQYTQRVILQYKFQMHKYH
jgi:hypothetical protein